MRLLADFYRHVLSLPLPFFEQRKTGDILSRLDENTKLTAFFTSTGADVFIDTLTAVMYLALMVHYNARLTVDTQRLSDDRPIAAQSFLPISVADYHRRRAPGLFLLLAKEASQYRANTQRGEI